jgi:hypothetical protein
MAAGVKWRCHAPSDRHHLKPFCFSFFLSASAGMPGKKSCTRLASTFDTMRTVLMTVSSVGNWLCCSSRAILFFIRAILALLF